MIGKGKRKAEFRVVLGIIGLIVLYYVWGRDSWAQEKPQYGGTLNFAVAEEPPSYDPHKESTFAVIHPTRPLYNLLLNFDPDQYPKVVGELAESWTISKDYRVYNFKIQQGVKFHDGSPLTARDIKASYDKIIFPPPGVVSARKAFYGVVEKVEAPDDYTVVFRLNRASASFLASLASPWNYIYRADILAKDIRWYEKNILGSGPFKFVDHVAGSHLIGKRNEDYFVKGRPFLDGYRAVFIRDTGARVGAVRSGRVEGEFRYLGPSQRDDVVNALGNKIRVQEMSATGCGLIIFNTERKPFDDPRVRRALSLALDRWEGAKHLAKISNMKEVGGLLRPGSEYSMNEAELGQMAGYWKDIEASRKEARRLLREAKVPEGFSFELKNRPPPKDFETRALFAIDQWRQIGINVKQKLQDLGTHVKDMRSGNFDMIVNAISDYMDEPDLQFIGFISADKSPFNFARYTDRVLDDLYVRQSKAMNFEERRTLCHQFEKRVLDEMVWTLPLPWNHRIVLHSARLKGWKVLSSHFLNQDLANVWLDKD
jgi:peptide/nickel transport system substrate-binding protein